MGGGREVGGGEAGLRSDTKPKPSGPASTSPTPAAQRPPLPGEVGVSWVLEGTALGTGPSQEQILIGATGSARAGGELGDSCPWGLVKAKDGSCWVRMCPSCPPAPTL